MFVVSSPPSTLRSLSALHTPIFQHDRSYPRSQPYQRHSARSLLKASGCKLGNCCHGQRRHCNGLDTLIPSVAQATPQMGPTLPLHLVIGLFEFGMLKLVLQLATLSRGTVVGYGLLLTLLMDGTSSLDLTIAPSGSRMPRL